MPLNDATGRYWAPGTVIFEDFVVKDQVGRGGRGEVYLVADRGSGDLHAVKRVRFLSAPALAALRSELILWIGLPPLPDFVRCRYFKEADGEITIFSEYVPLSLELRMSRPTRMGLPALLELGVELAAAISKLHLLGWIHGDLKPANILLDGGGSRLADFGTASTRLRVDGDRQLCTGTYAYASPEQSMGRQLSTRSDIWSLAVTLLEGILWDRPWLSGLVAPRWLDAARRAVESAGEYRNVGLLLVQVLEKSLAWEESARFDAADAMGRELRACWAGAPAGAPEPAWREDRTGPAHADKTDPIRLGRVPYETPEEFLDAKCGLLQASERRRIITIAERSLAGRARAVAHARAYAQVIDSLSAMEGSEAEDLAAEAMMNQALAFEAAGAIESAILVCSRMLQARNDPDGLTKADRRYRAWAMVEKALYEAVWWGVKDTRLEELRSALARMSAVAEMDGDEKLRRRALEGGVNEAVMLRGLQRFAEAIRVCDGLLEQLPNPPRSDDDLYTQAKVRMTRVEALIPEGRTQEAVAESSLALRMLLCLLRRLKSPEVVAEVGRARILRARALRKAEEHHRSEREIDRAITLLEQGGQGTTNTELLGLLAEAHRSKTEKLHRRDDHEGALAHARLAKNIYIDLTRNHGRREYRYALALAQFWCGCASEELGAHEEALDEFAGAENLLRFLIDADGRNLLRGRLAAVLAHRTASLFSMGRREHGTECLRRARMEIRQAQADGSADNFRLLERMLDRIETDFPH